MPYCINDKEGRQILKLAGTVTIRDAQELAAMLGDRLDDRASVAVETGELEDIDTCVLQLLCALRKSAAEFSLDHPSPVLIGAVDRCGLRRELLGTREEL